MSDPVDHVEVAQNRSIIARLGIGNIVAVLALLVAGVEALSAVVQVDGYKKQTIFAEEVKACATLMEASTEFRAEAAAFEAGEGLPDKAKLIVAREKLITSTRRIEVALDSLDLLAGSKAARETAELARQADRHLLLLDQEDYTPAQAKAWIDQFDAQVARAIIACHKDLLR